MNISANFKMSGDFNIHHPAGVYDDGYVRRDSTGNAGGQTTYWGYDNNSQYNPASQTLTMHSITSFSASGSSANDDAGSSPGFDMAYGDNLWYWKHARVGWELGFDLLPINITDTSPLPDANATQTTYVFNTGLLPGDPLIGAPYHGPYRGGIGTPTISSSPSSTSSQTFSGGTVTGSRSLDLILYSFRFGPNFYWDLTDKFGMSLGAGPAVGIVSGDYQYDEIITANGASTHNRGSFGSTDIVYGGYVNATVMYHLVDNGDIYAGVQYTPMTDAQFNSGGREADLNLNGQLYFTIGVNWPF